MEKKAKEAKRKKKAFEEDELSGEQKPWASPTGNERILDKNKQTSRVKMKETAEAPAGGPLGSYGATPAASMATQVVTKARYCMFIGSKRKHRSIGK